MRAKVYSISPPSYALTISSLRSVWRSNSLARVALYSVHPCPGAVITKREARVAQFWGGFPSGTADLAARAWRPLRGGRAWIFSMGREVPPCASLILRACLDAHEPSRAEL